MSLLKKSAPALLYAGIAAAAFGSAILSATLQSAVEHKNTTRTDNECSAILSGQKQASLMKQAGCAMRHGYHFGAR